MISVGATLADCLQTTQSDYLQLINSYAVNRMLAEKNRATIIGDLAGD
jgi:hypothetical protein